MPSIRRLALPLGALSGQQLSGSQGFAGVLVRVRQIERMCHLVLLATENQSVKQNRINFTLCELPGWLPYP
jgi:hypothetical protein